jgi:hypothetical protein
MCKWRAYGLYVSRRRFWISRGRVTAGIVAASQSALITAACRTTTVTPAGRTTPGYAGSRLWRRTFGCSDGQHAGWADLLLYLEFYGRTDLLGSDGPMHADCRAAADRPTSGLATLFTAAEHPAALGPDLFGATTAPGNRERHRRVPDWPVHARWRFHLRAKPRSHHDLCLSGSVRCACEHDRQMDSLVAGREQHVFADLRSTTAGCQHPAWRDGQPNGHAGNSCGHSKDASAGVPARSNGLDHANPQHHDHARHSANAHHYTKPLGNLCLSGADGCLHDHLRRLVGSECSLWRMVGSDARRLLVCARRALWRLGDHQQHLRYSTTTAAGCAQLRLFGNALP